MLIWLKAAAHQVALEDGILRAGHAQTLLEMEHARAALARHADDIMAAARREADRIVGQARAEAEALAAAMEAKVQAAQDRGYEDGTRRADLDWHARQGEHSARTAHALRAMHEKLADIVATAVERIVQTEPRSALYERALKSVQSLTRGASSLTLRVSPADHEHARSGLASLPAGEAGGLVVEVQVDPGLRAGSCIFESELGVLDASLQTQLDGLRMAMERAARRAVADGGEA